jgi:hypothetical protein
MPRYARVIFPRDPINGRRLQAPDVVRALDEAPMLEPRVTMQNVTLDVEMLPEEQLPDASKSVARRALEHIRQPRSWFRLPQDDDVAQ